VALGVPLYNDMHQLCSVAAAFGDETGRVSRVRRFGIRSSYAGNERGYERRRWSATQPDAPV
jgi:hypothetical protein